MNKRERFKQAKEEGTIYDFIIEEVGNKHFYKVGNFEITRNRSGEYTLIESVQVQWRHNDLRITTGTLEDCALKLAEKLG